MKLTAAVITRGVREDRLQNLLVIHQSVMGFVSTFAMRNFADSLESSYLLTVDTPFLFDIAHIAIC